MELGSKNIPPRVLKELEAMKNYIVFCNKCGQYGHELPQESSLLTSLSYWWHKDCKGVITVSKTTTHAMLDNLTFEQKIALHAEITDAVERSKEFDRKADQDTLRTVRNEIERRNRGSRNPLLPDSLYKRSLLSNSTGVPYCPQCDSLLVQPIRAKKRLFSVGLFGMASDTVGKSMECLSCKYKW